MLILARKVGEKIRIGDDIELVVVSLKGDTVRLGLKAPKGVSIHREEIYEAIQAENQAARATKVSFADMKKMMGQKPPASSSQPPG